MENPPNDGIWDICVPGFGFPKLLENEDDEYEPPVLLPLHKTVIHKGVEDYFK